MEVVCKLGFNENRRLMFGNSTCQDSPEWMIARENLLKRLEEDKAKIDLRAVEGKSKFISKASLIEYSCSGEPKLADYNGEPTELYCNGHMPRELPERLKEHFFGLDDEGRVINMHRATVCTGCGYFLKGRKD